MNNILTLEQFHDEEYVFHGTYDGAGVGIQRTGYMKLQAVNSEPFISFTSKKAVAKSYADRKGGSSRGIILRTRLTSDFRQSPKFKKQDGWEWITLREVPVTDLEIETKYGWVPLADWDFIDRKPFGYAD